MTKFPTTEGMTEFYIVLMVALVFSVVMIIYHCTLVPLLKKRRHIKTKIYYSDGEEYLFWKNELKQFYVQHLPFFGKIIVRFFK